MTSKELRKKYIEFFKNKGHVEIPSASLVPENDPSVLFTTAGMHPLVPFLLGEKHPSGERLVNFQKCVRTIDIDEVGNQWHLTFFEMLGNWSLGDTASSDGVGQGGYWKKEAIEWSVEFLTSKKWLGISKKKLAVSLFAGDDDAPFDEETYNAWKSLGILEEHIYRYPKSENWWGPVGKTGPCGPDTEMFYISDKKPCGPDCQPRCTCGKYVEIWNDVFIEYNKTADGKFEPLKQKSVDTGMGLERTVAILNNYKDNYQELLKPIIENIEKLSNKKYSKDEEINKSMRIIADHIRAATFIMGDDLGIAPSNVDQGYVVRKLIRRAIRHGKLLGINDVFCFKIAEVVIKIMQDIYPELKENKDFIIEQMVREEEKFRKTLDRGLKELNKLIQIGKIEKIKHGGKLPIINRVDAKKAFYIYQTYGFPLEMIQEELARRALLVDEEKFNLVDEEEFNKEMQKHQKKSRTASAGKFKGGLADQSEQVVKYHTATHLLLAALRKELGLHVFQKGSNITEKRLRFDFSHSEKMTPSQITEVEKLVNGWIEQNLKIECKEMSTEEAEKMGAMGVFTHKYGSKVKVYIIGDNISLEICGGPHVDKTGELGKFKIIKETSSSAGIRRIKAVLE